MALSKRKRARSISNGARRSKDACAFAGASMEARPLPYPGTVASAHVSSKAWGANWRAAQTYSSSRAALFARSMPRFIQHRAGDHSVTAGGGHQRTLQGRGVLIVEDEAMVAMLLEDLLQELG